MGDVDFTSFFAKDRVERLSFHTRGFGNYGHDVIFLSSYLHDSTFFSRELVLNDGIIRLDLSRACWECYLRPGNDSHHLPACRSRLIFSGVSRLKTPRRLPKRFEIGKVFLGQRSYTRQDYCELMIVDGWGNDLITLRAKNPFIDVSLEDVEEPV